MDCIIVLDVLFQCAMTSVQRVTPIGIQTKARIENVHFKSYFVVQEIILLNLNNESERNLF